jgi:tetratricopeptide (TPR) repeat protein
MRSRWIIASHVFLFSSAITLGAQSAALDEGSKFFRNGQFDQALVKFEEAHRISPRNATVENLIGITETQLGRIDEAYRHYRNAIRLEPSLAAAHKNLGYNLLTQKDYAGAEPELREASRLAPNDNFAHYYLLMLALATGRDDEAVQQAPHVDNLIDNDPDVGARLIEAEIRTSHVELASGLIEHMEKDNQLSSAREYAIAVFLSQHALYGQAVRCFRRISSLDPSWENRYNLALALLYDGEPGEASTLLAALHVDRPSNADILMFLGSSFEMQQKMPEALEAYRGAVLADPANPDRTLDYTRVLMDTDRYDDAIQAVQSGLGETSSTAPLQLRLGAVEMLKANYAAAREAFQSALAIDPGLDAAYVGLAQTYARQANDSEATRILESARTKLPNHYSLEYYFGLLAGRTGREQDAITALNKAAELQPTSPDPLFELGKLYIAQQDWQRARQALENVIGLNPKFQPAHYQLSHVYAHLGLAAKAMQEATKTRILVDTQRDEALRKQRERAASFQPQTSSTLSQQP